MKNDHIAFRYEVLSGLGCGTFGDVYKAVDHKTKTNVAIKVGCSLSRLCVFAFIVMLAAPCCELRRYHYSKTDSIVMCKGKSKEERTCIRIYSHTFQIAFAPTFV